MFFEVNGGTVSWRCRKQTCVTLPFIEPEIFALCNSFQDAVCLKRLLHGLDQKFEGRILLYGNNKSFLMMVDGEKFSKRLKHIDNI